MINNLFLFGTASLLLFSPAVPIFGQEVVNPQAHTIETQSLTGQSVQTNQQGYVDEDHIKSLVKSAILSDPELAQNRVLKKVDIDIENGFVILKGTVRTEELKSKIDSKVKSIQEQGIKQVINYIHVDPNLPTHFHDEDDDD